MGQIDITITDEFENSSQNSAGILDLDDGTISNIQRAKNSINQPWKNKDYEYTCGTIRLGNKELEFAIKVDKEEYKVSRNELLEINTKLLEMSQPKSKKPRIR